MDKLKGFDFTFTPEFCYCLGFLWGDGYLIYRPNSYVYSIAFEIVKEDFDEIIPIFQLISSWAVNFRKRDGRRETGIAKLGRKVLYEWLELYNYKAKDRDATILSIIPDEFKKYWLLGLIDADGHIWCRGQTINPKYKASGLAIYGPLNQDWTSIGKIFSDIGIKFKITKRIRNTGSGSEFVITNRKDLVKIKQYLYSDSFFGLKRKKLKFMEIEDYNKQMKGSS